MTKYCSEHNHEISKSVYDSYARTRALTAEEKEEVLKDLCLSPDLKKVQQKMKEKTNKEIQMSQIYNIKQQFNRDQNKSDQPDT